MIDYSKREQMVKQIIWAMDCEFIQDNDNSFWVNDGDWQVILPDRPESEVAIKVSQKLHPATAADIGVRFAGVATLLGLDVSFNGSCNIGSDSTGVVLIQEN